jgi:hypothetical protein
MAHSISLKRAFSHQVSAFTFKELKLRASKLIAES